MGLRRNVAAGVGHDINFEVLLEHVERWERHAGFRPQAGEDELLAPCRMGGLAKARVEPGVHRRAIDDRALRKQTDHLRHEWTRERVRGDRRNHGWDLEE